MPNNVTKPPILDNTGQSIKSKLSAILSALQSATSAFIPTSQKGAASGVAELDANGKVPSSQLPSYVDDVLEYASVSNFPATGEAGKIYIALDTNLTYRWSGSEYVEISPSLALGETSSTAYRGDRGKVAYDHATDANKISSAVASGLYKIAATAQGHIASLTAVQKSDLTALGLVDKSGDTMTGDLTVLADVIIDNDSNGGGHDLIIGHANALDSEQQCYIKFYRGQVSATTSLQAEQNINYDPNTGRFTPDANNYNILLPCKSGTIALISDIEALDGVITGSAGAGKTLTALSQTDGKISATFGNISITKSQVSDFPNLATVATSGSYTDLSNKPTIPTVNNSTITIKKNGTTVDSFTLNQSSAKNIDISVPTKTSDLTNDSGFVTTDEKVTAEQEAPTAETQYDLLFVPHSTRTTNQKPKFSTSLPIYMKNGTTSAVGYNFLQLGNGIASGTANNQYGVLRLYSRTAYASNLRTVASLTANRDIALPDKDGIIALTADLTTYAFAEGTNNGEIKITPLVGGTAGTAVTVKPKGISDLAYIAKGSGSSKFLREDGTWQTVTASWSGGQVTSNIYPNAQSSLNLGLPSRYFKESYVVTAFSNISVLGYPGGETGTLSFCRADSIYGVNITPPSLSANVALTLPTASGTLATQEMYYSKVLLNYACAAINTQYTVNLADSALNYDFLIFTSYQHTGGTSTSGRAGGAASIFPMFLGLPSNTAYNQQVQNFGYVLITSTTPTKATVYCSTNVAYGIVVIGVKFRQNN